MLKDTDMPLKQGLGLEHAHKSKQCRMKLLRESLPLPTPAHPSLLCLPWKLYRLSLCVRNSGRFWLPCFPPPHPPKKAVKVRADGLHDSVPSRELPEGLGRV